MASREASPEVDFRPTLGSLTLIGRKDGLVKQVCPLDGEVTTIGRNPESNLRIYLQDVSGLHAEIKFDLVTGLANLLVHGRNGLIYTPASGSAQERFPPSTILLTDGDSFSIRKKIWRFNYGEAALPPTQCMTPLKPAQAHGSPVVPRPKSATPVPRRSSYRLSIVPGDVDFAAVSSPRKGKTPRKSGLGNEVELGQAEMELVDVFDHDDGVKVYFERAKPIYENQFMTPQPARTAPEARNTDAAPRIRRLDFSAVAPPAKPVLAPAASPARVEPESLYPSLAALPSLSAPSTPAQATGSGTPSAATPTPASPTPAARPTPRVTAQVAYSTPKGPASLRKALLLRSARKVWHDSAAGVDGAIDVGLVEVRRKSMSPRSGRKSGSLPSPEADDANEEDNEEAGDDDEEQREPNEYQWVYEDGTPADGDDSFGSSDSDRDSVDADILSDVPGEMVVQLGTEPVLERASAEKAGEFEEENEEEEGEYEEEEEVEEVEGIEEGEEDEHVEVAEVDEREEALQEDPEDAGVGLDQYDAEDGLVEASVEQEYGADEEVSQGDEELAEELEIAHGSEVSQPRLASRFFTPQPKRHFTAPKPRRSLADIGGPARRILTPGRPQPTSNISNLTPGSPMTQPVARTPAMADKTLRRVGFAPDVSDTAEAHSAWPRASAAGMTPKKAAPALQRLMGASGSGGPATPVRSTPARGPFTPGFAASPRATPRTLPAPPSTFKAPVHELGSTMAMPHRALGASSATPQTPTGLAAPLSAPGAASDEAASSTAVPQTPMDALKARMRDMRRKSEVRAARRATLGAEQVAFTPRRAPRPSTALYTSMKDRPAVRAYQHASPTPHAEDDLVEARAGLLEHAHDDQHEHDEDALDEAECASVLTDRDEPATPPAYAPRAPGPHTPALSGLRDMYTLPAAARTPELAGVRGLFRQDKVVATPRFDGVKEMLRVQRRGTMHLDGVREMFADDEHEREHEHAQEHEHETDDDVVEIGAAAVEPPKRGRRAPTSAPTRRAKSAAAPAPTTRRKPMPAPARAPVSADADDADELDRIEVGPATKAVSAPARRRAPAAAADDDKAVKSVCRVKKTDEPEPEPEVAVDDKPSRPRAARTTARANAAPAPGDDEATADAKPKRGRPRKVLGNAASPPQPDEPAGPARPARAKTADSAPSPDRAARRTRAKAHDDEHQKENVAPAPPAAKSRARAPKAPAAKADAPVSVATRATRSRK
ncbi:hypothetical protein Q5752_006635 [Cryptotrichosporon argae]